MVNILIRMARVFHKSILGTLKERIALEKLFRDNRVYNYVIIPDECFKERRTYNKLQKWE